MKYYKSATASMDVDAQKGFTPLCPYELPVPGGDTIADALNEQAYYASLRIGSKDAHCPKAKHIATEEFPQYTLMNLPNTDLRWNRHCTMGTEGAELLQGLPNPEHYDYFIWKGIEPGLHPYSACYHDLAKKLGTGVIEYLRANSISCVIVGGLAWEFCVKETALDLRKAGFSVILNAEATRGISDRGVQRATEEMLQAGIALIDRTSDLSEIID